MAEKFVVKKGTTGKFRFSLLGRNGRVIATSEAYNSKAACLNGIKAVQAGAGRATIEDQTTRAWADEQARLKVATKTAAKAAKQAIKAAGKTVTAAGQTAGSGAGTARSGRTAGSSRSAGRT